MGVGWAQGPFGVAGGRERFSYNEGPTHSVGIGGDGEGPLGDRSKEAFNMFSHAVHIGMALRC